MPASASSASWAASNRGGKISEPRHSRITDARRIVAFRNRLIHGYASVANEVVWGVVEGNLAVLQREIQALLD